MINMPIMKQRKPISLSDQAFIQQFYEENKRFMFFVARKYSTSQTECEDIIQEANVRFIHNVSALRCLDASKIPRYIVLTIRAVFLDAEKQKRNDRILFLSDEMQESLIRNELLMEEDRPDLAARLDIQQLKQELPSRDWRLLEGKYIYGYSQEELGYQFGIAPDSVRSLLSRARKKARDILLRD